MKTNAEVIRRVDAVFGPSKTDAELLSKALQLIAAYDEVLARSDKNVAKLVAKFMREHGAQTTEQR